MATNVGTIVVELVTNLTGFKSGMDKAGKEIQSFSQKTGQWIKGSQIAITAAVTGISVAVVSSLKAYMEQEKAIAGLTTALKNQGIESLAVRDAIVAQASAYEKLSTFQDDQIVKAQTVLVQYGLTGAALKETTRVALDFAAATGRDLTDAANALGKASKGTTTEFSRMGMEFKKGQTDTEKFIQVLMTLDSRFQGQAKTMRDTASGGIQVMKNEFNNLQETVGSFLASDAVGFTKWVTGLITNLNTALISLQSMAQEVGGLGNLIKQNFVLALAAVGQTLIEILEKVPGIQKLFDLLDINLAETKTQLGELAIQAQNTMNANVMAAGMFVTDEQKKQQAIATTSAKDTEANAKARAEALLTALQGKQIKEKQDAEEAARAKSKLENEKKISAELAAISKENAEKEKKMWQDRAQAIITQIDRYTTSFGQGVADMVLEGRKFSQVMKSIWNDLARQIIMAIAKMIAKWIAFLALRGVLSAFGGAGAALSAALGAAMTSSGKMAEGGIIGEPSLITGMKTGRTYLAGEAGPEAVVPLAGNKNVAAGPSGFKFDQTPSQVGITINISGQFIEGNEVGWQRLIRDKIVPEIRRFTMASPTGPFNRRRGVTV